MLQEIQKQLRYLEQEKGIKILLAVESGSRAWGCPSPDSDYDVRIIYIHPTDYYLTIGERKDNINYFHGELLDINGWDIRKTLRLLSKSNATPFEWNQSPIVYQAVDGFQLELQELIVDYFQSYHSLNHYKGIAINSFKSIRGNNTINLKKLFYVIRPLLAAEWIVKKENVPPMDIPSLLSILDNLDMVKRIEDLIEKKKELGESYIHKASSEMLNFIHQKFQIFEQEYSFKKKKNLSHERLNEYFRELLQKY
ncbi:MAG: nucleotidyltransferase domain-containing protein [Bacteroidota bacterium]